MITEKAVPGHIYLYLEEETDSWVRAKVISIDRFDNNIRLEDVDENSDWFGHTWSQPIKEVTLKNVTDGLRKNIQ